MNGATVSPVSVVVPCYRCAETIRRAVASVMAQTVRPKELILVDDASGDQTLNVLQDIRTMLGTDWIRIIALPRNEGPGAARNVGWQEATGDYIAFLDADDAWHPEKLARQYRFMEAHPEFALSGHAARQLAGKDSIDAPVSEVGHTPIGCRALLLSNRFITPSVMVRRNVPFRFNPVRRHMEDHLLWMQMACAGFGIAKLNAELAYTFKAAFGVAGQSADTAAMELGELANYRQLYRERRIGAAALTGLLAFSGLKFARRLLLLALRRRGRARRAPAHGAALSAGTESLLSLSIVSHRQGHLIGPLLNDLRSCLSPSDEVILTINVPETLPFAPDEFPYQVRVHENDAPKGFGANHNAAFRHARGSLFCVMNPDIRIESDPFPALRECLGADSRIAACAPLIVTPDGTIEDSVRRFPTPSIILRKLLGRANVPDYSLTPALVYPDWIAGMFILLRSQAFAAVEGFDEDYFLYYEDVDLSARLALAGWRVAACPAARAIHDAQRQSRRSLRYFRWHTSSMLRFFASPVYQRVRRATRQAAP